MKDRPNTKGWELAARRYCELAEIDPDENVGVLFRGQPTRLQWEDVANLLFEHQRCNEALGVLTKGNSVEAIHS